MENDVRPRRSPDAAPAAGYRRDAVPQRRTSSVERSQFGDQAAEAGGRELAAVIATNVSRMRANLGMEVGTLAECSGLSPEVVAALEAEKVVPDLRMLWALASVFEVPFRVLVSGSRFAEATFRVQRADAGRVVVSGDGRFRSRAVSTTGDPREPEMYEITLAPGCAERAQAHAAQTFEHIVVVRGTLLVRAGDEAATLRPGDALFFRADRPHAYENPSSEETALHLTMVYAGDWAPEEPACDW